MGAFGHGGGTDKVDAIGVVVAGWLVLGPEDVVVPSVDVVTPCTVDEVVVRDVLVDGLVVGVSGTVDVVVTVDSVVVVSGNVEDDVVVDAVVVTSGSVVVVVRGIVVGGMVVDVDEDVLTVGATAGIVLVDVGGDVLLVVELLVVDVVLDQTPAVGADGGRRPLSVWGNEDVGICTEVRGCVVVVVGVAVERVVRTSELLGPMRSGMRPSVPGSRPPANSVIATMPTSATTTPLDAATIADCWRHHGSAGSSYSGTSSASNSHAFGVGGSASSNEANEELIGSGGGHIP